MSWSRLSARKTVVLPQPDGPMNAVMSWAATCRLTPCTAVTPWYRTSTSARSKTTSRPSGEGRGPEPGTRCVSAGGRVSTLATVAAGSGVWRTVDNSISTSSGGTTGVQAGHDSGQRGEDEHDQDQREGGAVAPLDGALERRVRVLEDLDRQRGVRPVEQARVRRGDDPNDEEERGGLSRGASNREEDAAHDPGSGVREDDGADRAHLAAPERVAPFAQLVGNGSQDLLGGADNDRQHQAAEGQRPGEAGLLLEVQHPDRVDEQAHDDRRDAGHDLGEEPDEAGEPTSLAVLVEVEAAEHAEGHGHGGRGAGDEQRPDDRGLHAATGGAVGDRDVGGDEVPAEDAGTLAHDIDQQEQQRDECDDDRRHDEDVRHGVAHPAAGLGTPGAEDRVFGGCRRDRGHYAAPSRRSLRARMVRAMTPMTTVSARSTTPSPMSADRWVPLASPNWLAMTLAIVSPGPRICSVRRCEDPMMSATAIVSPTARPKPMMTAAATPLRLWGNTEPRIISQRVAPSASAASFCDAGHVAYTSRVIAVMIGVIMMATTIPAVMKLAPLGFGLANTSPTIGMPEVAFDTDE